MVNGDRFIVFVFFLYFVLLEGFGLVWFEADFFKSFGITTKFVKVEYLLV